MPVFDTTRRVQHSAAQMFDLVADVSAYPTFLPFCTGLDLLEEHDEGPAHVFVARMEVGFKAVRESFKTRVTCDRAANHILVEYVDGPFRYLKNRWTFRDLAAGEPGAGQGGCLVGFHIEYEFKSRMLALVVGGMFDQAFRRFTIAFERRANEIYGRPPHVAAASRRTPGAPPPDSASGLA